MELKISLVTFRPLEVLADCFKPVIEFGNSCHWPLTSRAFNVWDSFMLSENISKKSITAFFLVTDIK